MTTGSPEAQIPRYLPSEYAVSVESHLATLGEQSTPAGKDPLWLKPYIIASKIGNMSLIGMSAIASDVLHAASTDLDNKENKPGLSLAAVLAAESFGAARGASLVTIPAAFQIAEKTGSSLVAGGAIFTLYGGLCFASSHILNNGVTSFPQTFKRIGSKDPDTSQLPESFFSLRYPNDTKTIWGRGGDHLRRGGEVYAGLGFLVYAGGALGRSVRQRDEHCNLLSFSGATFLGALATGVTKSVDLLEHSHPELAQNITKGANSPMLIFLALTGLAVTKPLRKRLKNELSEHIPQSFKRLASLGKLACKGFIDKISERIPDSVKDPEAALSIGAVAIKLITRRSRHQVIKTARQLSPAVQGVS